MERVEISLDRQTVSGSSNNKKERDRAHLFNDSDSTEFEYTARRKSLAIYSRLGRLLLLLNVIPVFLFLHTD